MTNDELKEVLASHQRWLDGDPNGKRANLHDADLSNADLSNTNLRAADLHDADLFGANLSCANLIYANLRNADLRYTNLIKADLRGADLCDADLDYSAWPLWCGSMGVKINKRIAAQLLYHALRAMQSCADEPDVAAVLASEPCLKLANQFHRVDECGRIEPLMEGDTK